MEEAHAYMEQKRIEHEEARAASAAEADIEAGVPALTPGGDGG